MFCSSFFLLFYIGSLLSLQASWVTNVRPSEYWPENGRLRFEDYKVRYRAGLDLVLHGISCDINSSEKVCVQVSGYLSV